MTEQYTPSDYDIHVQNPRIDQLESLITAEYQPPAGVEYSFPVANQGITQDQFRLMHLGQANGIIHGDNGTVNDNPNSTGYRYYLDGHDSDADTNQRNTLILRAGSSAEAIVEGFYHRLTEDMELPFPPVTTTTVYHVTITYDPRDFKTNPVKIQVYPGEPPTSYGRVHLLLHTVERRPNELLTQATRTRYRPYTAGIVAVQHPNQLPNWRAYPAGTLAVPSGGRARGTWVRSNTTGDWLHTSIGEWQDFTTFGAWRNALDNPVRWRYEAGGIRITGILAREGETYNQRVGRFDFTLPVEHLDVIGASNSPFIGRIRISEDGAFAILDGPSSSATYFYVHTFIPLDV